MKDTKMSPKFTLRVTALTAIAAIIAGCSTAIPTYAPYDELHKVRVAEMIERLELYIRPEGMNVSARDRSAMMNFFRMYGTEGDGVIYMNVPASAKGTDGLRQAEAEVQSMMTHLGLSPAAIQMGSYPAAPGQPAPIMLSFRRFATLPGNCHNGQNMTQSYNNMPYYNFGCASQSNFAAMVADPRQLLDGYDDDPAMTARRSTVLERYVEGQNTAATQPVRQEIGTE